MTLQERCAEARKEQHLTVDQLAARANLPSATVERFLSPKSKQPYIGTVAPICAVLGVSIDAFYDIKTDVPEHEKLRQENIHIKELNESIRKSIYWRNIFMLILSGIAFLSLAITLCIVIAYFKG